MSIVSWITSNPVEAIALGSTIAGWLGLKKRDASQEKREKELVAKLQREAAKLLAEHASPERARELLDEAADAVLKELNWKRNAAVDTIVDALLDEAIEEYGKQYALATMQLRLDELHAAVAKIPASFEYEGPTQPKSPTTRILGPDEPFTTFAEDEAAARAAQAAAVVREKIAKTPPDDHK